MIVNIYLQNQKVTIPVEQFSYRLDNLYVVNSRWLLDKKKFLVVIITVATSGNPNIPELFAPTVPILQ